MARAKVYHRICNVCHIDKLVSEYPKYSTKCNECITGSAKGKEIICAECGKVGKLCARGLCNTCYDRWSKSRLLIVCVQCKESCANYGDGLCVRCHSSDRYKHERDTWLEQQRKARKDNPEKFKAQDSARHQKRKASGEAQRRARKFYIANRDDLLKYQQKYHKEHPGLRTHYTHVRMARIKSLPYTLTVAEWNELIVEYNYCCYYCKTPTSNPEREHKQPASRKGGYTKENIVPACASCNRRKKDKTEAEFFAHLRLLGEIV